MWNKSVREKEDIIVKRISIQTIFISMFGFVICLCALCSTTWAWFNDSTNSGNNVIETGSLKLSILLDDVVVTDSTTISKGEHTIKLSVSEDSTVSKGYCKIKINGVVYITSLLEINSEGLVINVVSDYDNIIVEFEEVWGMPANPTISNDDNQNTIIVQ